jgi:hypothetical protein
LSESVVQTRLNPKEAIKERNNRQNSNIRSPTQVSKKVELEATFVED